MAVTELPMRPMLIAGEAVAQGAAGTIDLMDPSTGLAVATAPLAGVADIDRAVAAANAVQPEWAATAGAERGRLLFACATAIRANADQLAEAVMRFTGHSKGFSGADVVNAARYFDYYGGVADKIHGESIPLGPDHIDFTLREPYGVCAIITPFNGPLQMLGRSVAPALAAGNAAIVKPTEQAPGAALALAEVLAGVGLPAGILSVIPGGIDAGQRLVGHPDVHHVTFTGSVRTGAAIMAAASEHITPVTLELGGKSPQLVFADADLDAIVAATVGTALVTAGQVCSAGTSILVQREVQDELLDRLRTAIANITIGPPEDGADMGPVISAASRERINVAIGTARADGAKLVVGGDEPVPDVPAGGHFVRPTVFADVDPRMGIAREEIFGPVIGVIAFDRWEEALELANATDFGLVSGVWTRDIGLAMHLSKRLQSGQVFVNNYGAGGGIELPFGGYKRSGIGREKGMAALNEYTQVKNVCVLATPPAGQRYGP
jgi:aldehyde dehydrogenase (NAD+)